MVEEEGLDEEVEEGALVDNLWLTGEFSEGSLPQTQIMALFLTLVLWPEMLNHLYLDNLFPSDPALLELRAHVECRSRKLQILPLEHTKISQMDNTSA